jgi:hypothetical protein
MNRIHFAIFARLSASAFARSSPHASHVAHSLRDLRSLRYRDASVTQCRFQRGNAFILRAASVASTSARKIAELSRDKDTRST